MPFAGWSKKHRPCPSSFTAATILLAAVVGCQRQLGHGAESLRSATFAWRATDWHSSEWLLYFRGDTLRSVLFHFACSQNGASSTSDASGCRQVARHAIPP